MVRFAWNEGNQVGVSSIDTQHGELGELIDGLDDRIAAGAAMSEIKDAFDRLYIETRAHFLHEEGFFASARFDRGQEHKREHDRLLLILKRFCQGIEPATVSQNSAEHSAFLRSWLVRHIQNEDRRLGIHLNSLGIR